MPNEQEPVDTTTETASVQVNDSQVEDSTKPAVTVPEVKVEQVPDPNVAELERVKKELNQARMRENQLVNEKKEAARKQLEESNDFKTLYEESQAEIKARDEQIERDTAASEAKALRDSAIDSYPDERVRAAAKKLVAKNESYFYWGTDAADEVAAQAEVKSQLDVFAESFGPAPTAPVTPTVVIDSNNPLEGRDTSSTEQQDALRERLATVSF